MYCETCMPAVMLIGTVRGSPAPRSSTLCGPGFSASVSGVTPPDCPSTITCAPGGLLLMFSVPVADAVELASTYLRATYPPPATTATTAATAAIGFHGNFDVA